MNAEPELTRNQSLVLSTLERAEAPLGAYAILEMLRGQGLKAPLQVYRALETLIGQGLVHKVESLNAFVACAGGDRHLGETVAFAICEGCGQVTEFADSVVRDHALAWCRTRRFSPLRTTLEIRGRCASCAAG